MSRVTVNVRLWTFCFPAFARRSELRRGKGRTQDAADAVPAETFLTAGGTHRPSTTSAFGAYNRMQRLKSPAGAGNQFDSFSLPGELCWKYRSTEPSALYFSSSRSPIAFRFRALGEGNPCSSYKVTDQKAPAGGILDLSKWST